MSSPEVPEQIGPFRILRLLGQGGMGQVYLAEQSQPVRRRVALKIVLRAGDQRSILARFELERQALAMMNHPNIARVLEAGSTEDGSPYFAMELVQGEPITAYCDKHRASLTERLSLFVQVCNGVQHAHHKGVVHRDLKPGNILVELLDERPVARIIDFGLARATNHLLAQQTVFTEVGQVIGTPEYMSPEQAEMGGIDVDTRTDIYSLGVLLYELLTGTLPFPSAELRNAGLFEIRRRIREVDPPLPSRRVVDLEPSTGTLNSRARQLSAVALAARLRNDLDWIVMRCLEKNPGRRYQTPSELAADVERFLRGEAVTAVRPSFWYLMRKFAQRHRAVATIVPSVFSVLGVALVWVLHARSEEASQRRTAESALLLVQRQSNLWRGRELLASATQLDPVGVDNITAAEQWLADADVFLATMKGDDEAPLEPEHEQKNRELRRDLDACTAALSGATGWRDKIAGQLQRTREAQRLADPAVWEQVAARVHQRYGGLPLVPIPGLVPLGPDPSSGLEEFAVLQTGSLPERRPGDHVLLCFEDAAIVLVLLPGADTEVGANADDERAQLIEKPRTPIKLSAFFLGKHEITQVQWKAMTGTTPSLWHAGRGPPEQMRMNNPVEQVSWLEAWRGMAQFSLTLPTEAQWEYAARAGTQTPWWTGPDKEAIGQGGAAENIADAATIVADMKLEGVKEWPDYNDTGILHMPVGSFRANGFGLFDMLGNVKEFCADAWVERPDAVHLRSGDGLRQAAANGRRAVRGGSWFNSVSDARASSRKSIGEEHRFDNVGIRAARQLRQGP